MPPEANPLAAIVVLIGAAVVSAGVLRVLRAPAIIGFLLAGVAIGPHALGLIHSEQVSFFAEIGLVLLLFSIGLELSPEPLLQAGWRLLCAGLLQMGLTTAAVLVALLSTTRLPPTAAAVVAFAVSLSSTAIVLKQLSDRGETDSTAGVVTIAILLLQDVAVIIVLMLLPLLAASGASGGGGNALKILLAVAAAPLLLWVARLAMPAVLRTLFRLGGRELLTLFAVLMAVLGAWIAGQFGLSWPIGACLAGLLLATTDVRHQLCAEITPFRDLFNAIFFISIGMLVNLEAVAAQTWTIAALAIGALLLKSALTTAAVRLPGWPARIAIHVGLGLCTISEFGFVLGQDAARHGLLPTAALDTFVAVAVGSMLLGAALVPSAGPLSLWITRRRAASPPDEPSQAVARRLAQHVVVVGAGLNGRNLAQVLRATGIPHCVTELNPTLAAAMCAEGSPTIVGDATRWEILQHAAIQHARALVVCINDVPATRSIVVQARQARSDLYILARTRFVAELEPLYRLGARQVIPEEFETSIEIFAHVLKEFGVPDNVIHQQVTLVRAGRYGMLRRLPLTSALRGEWARMLEAAVTQTYLLDERSPAAGRTIRQLDLRRASGATILAVTRGGKPQANPPADMLLKAGDVLVLVGAHAELDSARRLLDPPADGAQTSLDSTAQSA